MTAYLIILLAACICGGVIGHWLYEYKRAGMEGTGKLLAIIITWGLLISAFRTLP